MQSSACNKALFGLCGVTGVRCFTLRQSGSAGCQYRYRSDDVQLRPNIQSPERTKAVTSFYFQPAVDQAAAKVSALIVINSTGYHAAHVIHLGICEETSLVRVLVDYALRKRQNLVFPVGNYISSILITSVILDDIHGVIPFRFGMTE